MKFFEPPERKELAEVERGYRPGSWGKVRNLRFRG